MAAANTPPREEDDLFDFDKLDPGTKSGAAAATAAAAAPRSVSAGQAAAPATPPAPAASAVEPRAQPAHPPAAHPVAAATVPRPVLEGAAPGTILVQERKPEPWRPALQRSAPTSSHAVRTAAMFTGGALALATFVNLTLAGVVWKSMTGLDRALAGGALGGPRNAARGEPVQAPGASLAAPVPDEGELALAVATEEIGRGEFERARARIYSLLSVIDRFDGPARARLASRAQVLAADSFREQAEALDRMRQQQSDEPGFVDPEAEDRR